MFNSNLRCDVEKQASLQKSKDELEKWLKNHDNKRNVEAALHKFIKTFQDDINAVYSAWET